MDNIRDITQRTANKEFDAMAALRIYPGQVYCFIIFTLQRFGLMPRGILSHHKLWH